MSDEIPWRDPEGLNDWIFSHFWEVTPFILCKLFELHGLVEVETSHSRKGVTQVTYASAHRIGRPSLAGLRFVVYHQGANLATEVVMRGLQFLEAVRRQEAAEGCR